MIITFDKSQIDALAFSRSEGKYYEIKCSWKETVKNPSFSFDSENVLGKKEAEIKIAAFNREVAWLKKVASIQEPYRFLKDADIEMEPWTGYSDATKKLLAAAKTMNITELKDLIENKKADANAVDKDQKTLLELVVEGGSFAMVEYLVKTVGVDVNAARAVYASPLHSAAELGKLDIVKFLFENGAYINQSKLGFTPLFSAVQGGNLDVISYLIDVAKADVNAVDQWGTTPLHKAIRSNQLEAVKLLVKKGADVNQKTKHFGTPLFSAAEKGNLEIMRYLIEDEHVDVNVKVDDSENFTPLHNAVTFHKLDAVKFLIKKGADVNQGNWRLMTPLFFAVRDANLAIVRCLVEEGKADVNSVNEWKETPLFLAGRADKDLEIVKYLIEKGADVGVKNNKNETALEGESDFVKKVKEFIKSRSEKKDGISDLFSSFARSLRAIAKS
ncbi:MAG: hypothetical protein UW09_C0003G0207 [candidate division TM6 bacterium GW2011_GWF2_43_87]|nr:MAG: hypothetical protein UW09_C0003G0207 [candidate division TM6 bacterium GW2011_GWF2_43_87]